MSNQLQAYQNQNIETYYKAVSFIIDRSRLDLGYNPLDNELMAKMSMSWTQHLVKSGIKEHELSELYNFAFQLRTKEGKTGPFGVDELLRARKEQREYEVNRQLNKPVNLKKCPNNCVNGRIMLVNSQNVATYFECNYCSDKK